DQPPEPGRPEACRRVPATVPAPSRTPAFPAVDASGGGTGHHHRPGPVEPTDQLPDAM
ncbi:hypothetical protein, partial [Pseudomonas sp. FG-3G]